MNTPQNSDEPEFHVPTKEELKAKYQIAEDDFEILVAPSKPEAGPGEVVEQAASFCGIPTYFTKRMNSIVAVVLVIVLGPGAVKQWGARMADGVCYLRTAGWDAFQNLPKPTKNHIHWDIGFHPHHINIANTANNASGYSVSYHLTDGTSDITDDDDSSGRIISV